MALSAQVTIDLDTVVAKLLDAGYPLAEARMIHSAFKILALEQRVSRIEARLVTIEQQKLPTTTTTKDFT